MTADAEPFDLLGLLLEPADVDADDDWRYQAVCASTDPEVFFPEKGGSTREAKKVCAGCPVREQCLQWAIATGQGFGVWGGMSERERRKYAKEQWLPFGSERLPSAAYYGEFEDWDDETNDGDDE